MVGEGESSGSVEATQADDSQALVLQDLSVGYNQPLISNINKKIMPGESIAILGPSGIGKTTLLRTIAGLIRPLSGTISHDYPDRSGIGYIPQRLGLVRHSTVRSNISIGARSRCSKWYPALFPLPSELKNDVDSAMESLNIMDLADEPVRILSGGQQRRVAIARTLIQKPRIILADEFLGELDKDNVKSIIEATRKVVDDIGATLIMVEHHEERAIEMADRIWRIKGNQLIEEGDLNQ
ncbi:ATP-binding cassette domain-containing protein [Candidatus Poseidoniaceae archaeon]|nr:ATP-binding cassette domain-containing protein [Candidatus Poseidoniaceae archaeon]